MEETVPCTSSYLDMDDPFQTVSSPPLQKLQPSSFDRLIECTDDMQDLFSPANIAIASRGRCSAICDDDENDELLKECHPTAREIIDAPSEWDFSRFDVLPDHSPQPTTLRGRTEEILNLDVENSAFSDENMRTLVTVAARLLSEHDALLCSRQKLMENMEQMHQSERDAVGQLISEMKVEDVDEGSRRIIQEMVTMLSSKGDQPKTDESTFTEQMEAVAPSTCEETERNASMPVVEMITSNFNVPAPNTVCPPPGFLLHVPDLNEHTVPDLNLPRHINSTFPERPSPCSSLQPCFQQFSSRFPSMLDHPPLLNANMPIYSRTISPPQPIMMPGPPRPHQFVLPGRVRATPPPPMMPIHMPKVHLGHITPLSHQNYHVFAVSPAVLPETREMVICRKPRSPRHLVKKRKIMDELLLGSHLRRVDSEKDTELTIKSHEIHIHTEKPTTPYIVLPDEPRFHPLLKKSRYALDIGGTLVKLVYSCVVDCDEGLQVLLNFKKFMSIEECLTFVQQNWTDRCADDMIHCTGGGSFKHAQHLSEVLGVRVRRTDEMHSLIFGCDFLLQNNEDESFTYHHEAVGVERFQYKPTSKESIYPFLLVNIGTGISVLKVDSPSTFQRVGGSSMGGGAFIGLGSLLTEAKDFDELLLLAERGDHRKCDTLVSDIYGGGYDSMGLSADLIAGSFGKCNRLDPRTMGDNHPIGADIAKSLLLMISNNIGQMAMLYGHRFQMKRIYFGGFFIRKHPITMRTLTYAINFWSKGEVQALFMKHEGYLGAVGAFLDE